MYSRPKSKFILWCALALTPLSHAQGDDLVNDENVVLDDGVRFEQHFKAWDPETTAVQKVKKTAGVVAVDAVAAGAFVLTSYELDEHIFRMKKLNEAASHIDPKTVKAVRARLSNQRWSSRISKLSYGVAIVFVADAITGVVVAVRGHEPIYAGNLPALAGYLVRKKYDDDLPPASRKVRDEMNELVDGALQEVAN